MKQGYLVEDGQAGLGGQKVQVYGIRLQNINCEIQFILTALRLDPRRTGSSDEFYCRRNGRFG